MSIFRDSPRPLRNALEVGLLVFIVLALLQGASTPDSLAYITERRKGIHLDCAGSGSGAEREHYLATWIYELATGTYGEACSLPLPAPAQDPPLGLALLLFVATGLVALAAVATLTFLTRSRYAFRGRLFGRPVVVTLGVVGILATGTALVLRYRLYSTHESLIASFEEYKKICWAIRTSSLQNDVGLEEARKMFCKQPDRASHALCIGTTRREHENALRELCVTKKDDGHAEREEVCVAYGFHLANRRSAARKLDVGDCREIADQQPGSIFAIYAPKVGLGVGPVVDAPSEEGLEPSASATATPTDSTSSPSVPGFPVGVAPNRPDGGAGVDTPTPSKRIRTVEETIEEIRERSPDLTEEQLRSAASKVLLGVPMPLAILLVLAKKEGNTTVTRRRVVKEVEELIARGEQPSISPSLADDIAEIAKSDRSIDAVLPLLPKTPKVVRVSDTVSCAASFKMPAEVCASGDQTTIAGVAENHRKSCAQTQVDQLGLAAIGCCHCEAVGTGCAEIRSHRLGYDCTQDTPK